MDCLTLKLHDAAKRQRKENEKMLCPNGHKVEYVEGDFPTGVESMGMKEYAHEKGYYCEHCDKVFDLDDLENDPRNADEVGE